MAINPYTGRDETWPGDPAGFAAAPPAAMPPPPMPAPAPPIPGMGDQAMGMGQAAAPPPPDVLEAMQTIQQVDAVLGPSQSPGGGAGAPPPPGQPPPGMPAAPVAPPPLAGLMSGTTGQQRQAIRQQQVAGLEAGRALDSQETDLDRRAGDLKVGVATTDAAAQNLQALRVASEEDERQQTANLFAARQQEAQQASSRARDAWVNAKPTDWFDEVDEKGQPVLGQDGKPIQDDGKTLLTSLGIALAHMADELNRGRGIQSNIGQQAMGLVDRKIEQHRVREVQRIEQLHRKAQLAGQNVDQLGRDRAAALAQIEDKYAGIQKRLEAEARAQRAQMGLDAAGIERDQAVVARTRKTLEQEQRRLDALNGFTDRATALEIQQQRANRVGRGRGGAGGPADPKDPFAGMTAAQRYDREQKLVEREIPNLDGSPAGHAKTRQEAEKLRAGAGATNGFIDAMGRLQNWVKDNGTVALPLFETTERKERENIIQELTGYVSEMRKTGVLQDKEYTRYMGALSPGTWESKEGAISGLEKLKANAAGYYARQVRAQGVTGEKPAEQAPTQPETMPAQKPQGTAKWAPDDVQALQFIKANPNWPERAAAIDALKRKYGAAAVAGATGGI
jgi:hypothetical protein